MSASVDDIKGGESTADVESAARPSYPNLRRESVAADDALVPCASGRFVILSDDDLHCALQEAQGARGLAAACRQHT